MSVILSVWVCVCVHLTIWAYTDQGREGVSKGDAITGVEVCVCVRVYVCLCVHVCMCVACWVSKGG